MKSIALTLVLFALFILCSNMQCGDDCNDTLPPEQSIRFVSATTGEDLLLNGMYNRDSLQVFYLKNDSTAFTHSSFITEYDNKAQVYINLIDFATGYIFQFNSSESDTLYVSHYTEDSDCYGVIARFRYGIFHGDTVHLERNGDLVLKQ